MLVSVGAVVMHQMPLLLHPRQYAPGLISVKDKRKCSLASTGPDHGSRLARYNDALYLRNETGLTARRGEDRMDISELGKQNKKPVRIFCCYAREDQPLLLHFKTQMAALQQAGLVTLWADTDINAGGEWEKEIHSHLDTADIILLFVSPDFMASNYCYGIEMQKALERHKRREARVIPIILRPVRWQEAPFSRLQILPTNATPVTHKKWRDLDDAFLDVVNGILNIIETLTGKSFPREYVSSLSQTLPAPPMPVRPSPIPTPGNEPQKQSHPARNILLGFLIIFLLGGVVASIYAYMPRGTPVPQIGETATAQANAHATATALANAQATAQANAHATATAQANATATAIPRQNKYISATSGIPVLDDPLSDNSKGHVWNVGSGYCQFPGGGLHAIRTSAGIINCDATGAADSYSNFAFQVQMMLVSGDAGGIDFRSSYTSGYFFTIGQDGSYNIYRSANSTLQVITHGSSAAINRGVGQINLVTVIAQNNTFDFYVNTQYVTTVTDSAYSQGFVGVDAQDISNPTEVTFNNAKVWKL